MNDPLGTKEPSIERKFRERDIALAAGPDLTTRHELFLRDAREMGDLDVRQIHLVVTSPPC